MKFEKERGLEALTETLVWPEVGERWEWWGGGGFLQRRILDLQFWMERNSGLGLGQAS